MSPRRILSCLCMFISAGVALAEEPKLTSLSDPTIRYTVPAKPYVRLARNGIEAVVVDNRAVDDDVLSGHREGYSGLASLKGAGLTTNLFVPGYAGLNFEHIHDGTTRDRDILFEPRRMPMELRLIDEHTAELYQKPTTNWGLESCLRYHMFPDGAIEMTFECIPRKKTFKNGYIGLFWASYIHQPQSGDIHFLGVPSDKPKSDRGWVRGVTPEHGTDATHLSLSDQREFRHDADFPLSLVFHRSRWRYAEPWYFGISSKTAFVQMFRPGDGIRITQSPSGGGRGNPAWDFQFFIPNAELGRRYQMVMRAKLVPFETAQQVTQDTQNHRTVLAK